jgi:hypothetical protein
LALCEFRNEVENEDGTIPTRRGLDRKGTGRQLLGRHHFPAAGSARTKEEIMNSQTLGLRVASVVFGLVSIAQLTRLLMRPEIMVNGWQFPLWPSAIAFVVLAGLSAWMWKLSHGSK